MRTPSIAISACALFLVGCQTTVQNEASFSELYGAPQPLTEERRIGKFSMQFSALNEKNFFTASLQPVTSRAERKEALQSMLPVLEEVCADHAAATGKANLAIVLSKYISLDETKNALLVPLGCPIKPE